MGTSYKGALNVNAEELYQNALSNIFDPSKEENDVLVNRGRFRPLGNHHVAVIDHFAEKYNADEVQIVIPYSDERTWNNPYTSSEVEEMFDITFDQRDVDYGLEVHQQINGKEGLKDQKLLGVFEKEPVLFTRDPEHVYLALAGKPGFIKTITYGLNKVFDTELPTEGNFSIDFEPRSDETPFDNFEGEVMLSSSSLRIMIGEDEDYQRYVPDPVAELIERNREAKDVIREQDSESSGKWMEFLS